MLIKPNHLNLVVSCDCIVISYSIIFCLFRDPGIFVSHNKLVLKLGSLFCEMATAKFELEKFDGKNSFSLWRIKMWALL
jgi:hypothetical protein